MLFEPAAAAALGVPVRILNHVLLGLLILVLVSSLQAVGCLLALGLLVLPAATVYLVSRRPETLFWGGGLVGALGAATALFLSHHLDVGTGAAIILTLGALFFTVWLLPPISGLLRRRRPQTGSGR
jgi:ABC-type Mn2+/Zn2+ transport system permease subunit